MESESIKLAISEHVVPKTRKYDFEMPTPSER